ncbi:MBL fold metallo-hydrolase [Pseudokineococcus basanitobsidens]|uniref:MBL fold metallo-hydrolase n=1 Tax=Pseudokineococcus basanitobsidens TaxID=1926649 RepID=A0ABU8RHS4_9ACTN
MLLRTVPAQVLGTNTLVLADGPGERGRPRDCLLVDVGLGVADRVLAVVDELHLRPVAVLVTHGHLDHVGEAAQLARAADVPVVVHAEDAHRLADPVEGLGPQLRTALAAQLGDVPWTPPEQVRLLVDGDEVVAGDLRVRAVHAPGHTEGSTLYLVEDVPDGASVAAGGLPPGTGGLPAGVVRTALTGDVLFAGSVGRTDLPGGDGARMQATLRDVVLALPDDTLVVPGHGPATTVRHERATNPFLTGA